MNFLLVRLVLWFFTLAIWPIPTALLLRSFQVEVLQRITLVALPQERTLGPDRVGQEWTERVLVQLEKAEKKEIDPWLRDDLRIAWITAKWSQYGIPEWSWQRNSPPYVAATYQVLDCLPEEVWPLIVAQRKAKLGPLYDQVWGDHVWGEKSSPRKPVQSVKLRAARKNLAG